MAKTSLAAQTRTGRAKTSKARAAASKKSSGKQALATGVSQAVPARAKSPTSKGVSKSTRQASTTRAGKVTAGNRGRATAAPASTAETTAINAQVLAHGLNDLLHTMQVVQQHEEALCSLMHALRRGRANASLLRDLRSTLAELPAQEYLSEVDALRDAVAA